MRRGTNMTDTRRAVLYLRRSTDEHQAESLDTQRESATRFCHARGWSIVGEVVDDGESRAEFKKRRGLLRLVAMCSARDRDFDIVVCRDESRIGVYEREGVCNQQRLLAMYKNLLGLSADQIDREQWEEDLQRMNAGQIDAVVVGMVRSPRFQQFNNLQRMAIRY